MKNALLLLFSSTLSFAADVHINITVGMSSDTLMHDGTSLRIWGFREDGSASSPYWVPGPTIRCKEGDHLFIHFANTSGLEHTIHAHGMDVPQAVDGVPSTSATVPPFGEFVYDFIVPHAGTYAYHCHVHTVLHLQMGMYGSVIVDPISGSNTVWEAGPAFDRERLWVTGEYDSYWHWLAANGGHPTNFPFHEYNPDYFIVNGMSGTDISEDWQTVATFASQQKMLLRLNNIGGFLPHRFRFGQLQVQTVISDGRPLPEPMRIFSNEITVYPGERYGVLVEGPVGEYMTEIDYLSIYDESLVGSAEVPLIIYLEGDSTRDGKRDILDLIQLLNGIANPSSLGHVSFLAADLDENGVIETEDFLLLLPLIL